MFGLGAFAQWEPDQRVPSERRKRVSVEGIIVFFLGRPQDYYTLRSA